MLRQHQPVKSGPIAARGRVSQMFLFLVPLFLALMHPHGPASPRQVLVSAPSFLPSRGASKGSYVAKRRAEARNPEAQGSALLGLSPFLPAVTLGMNIVSFCVSME